MQNKQLERQLRSLIQGLKGNQITRIMEILQSEEGFFLNKNFTKSGVNCTCCSLVYDKLTVTGFGRNQQEAFINASKNYLETLVATNMAIPQLKNALRLRDSSLVIKNEPKQPIVSKVQPEKDDTIDLEGESRLGDISQIGEQKSGCNCVYYEVHKHHLTEIKNLQARMKLIIKQNEMLKQLVLKDMHRLGNKLPDKENHAFTSNLA